MQIFGKGHEFALKEDITDEAYPNAKTVEIDNDFDLNLSFNGWRRARNHIPKNAPEGIQDSAFYLQMWTGNEDGTCIEVAFGLGNTRGVPPTMYMRCKGWGTWSKWVKVNTTDI